MSTPRPWFGDDPDNGGGSWILGYLYGCLTVPLALFTVALLGLAISGLLGNTTPAGLTMFVPAAMLGGLTWFCGARFRYWFGTALNRRAERQAEAGAKDAQQQLASTSASAPTAVPSRLETADRHRT